MTKANSRQTTYWLISLSIVLAYIPLSRLDVPAPDEAHTLMEGAATLIGLFIGLMSLVRFYSNRNAKYLILGAGFIGVAILDGSHVILNINELRTDSSSNVFSLDSPGWLVSQLLFSFTFVSIFLAGYINIEKISKNNLTKKLICNVTIYSLLFIVLMIGVVVISRYYENTLFYKASQYMPSLILALALIGHIKISDWRTDELTHLFVIAIIINLFSQLLFIPASLSMFDTMHFSSHGLQIISYICILSGLIISFHKDFVRMETEVNVRKYAQNALEASEVRNRTLMSSLVDGLVTINNKGIIENINNSACVLFGYSKLEVLGKNIKIFMPDPYQFNHDGYLSNYAKTGQKHIIGGGRKVTGLKKSGETFPIDLSVSEMIINGVKKFSGIVRDDTARRKAEEEIIESRNNAEIAAQAKSNFLATMSHEIRTPMNGVIGMVELLQDTSLDDNQKDIVNTISESGNALVNLINDILEISKIEAGKIEFHYSEFDLEKAAYEVTKLLKPRADANNIELILHYHRNCPTTVIGDAGRIRQILLNLIGNAIKFTHYGHVIIDIDCTNTKQNTNDITFKIIDTGIGINQNEKKALFESFTQADSSTSREYGGTGLGLSICQQLITLLDGKLDVESSHGKGSTFWFRLNLESKETESSDIADKLKNIKILSVTKNPENRLILKEHLKQWGMDLYQVNNTEEAIELLSENKHTSNPFHLIILDNQHKTITGKHTPEISNFIKNTSIIKLITIPENKSRFEHNESDYISSISTPILSSVLFERLNIAIGNNNYTPRKENIKSTSYNYDDITIKANILLVEDVIINQKVAIGIMSKFDINIDIANNGKEAVEKQQKNNYDLILMDCQMPVLDGYEATKMIRKNDNKTPVIAITANALSTDKEICLNAGMNDYISKPYNKQQLIDMLLKWLNINNKQNTATPSTNTANNTMTNSKDCLQYSKLEEMNNIMGKMFNELIPAYIEQSDNYIKNMPDALSNDDLTSLERYAHSMKSSSLNVGAEPLSELSKELEQMSHDQEVKNILSEKIEQIQAEYKKVKEALLEYQQRGQKYV